MTVRKLYLFFALIILSNSNYSSNVSGLKFSEGQWNKIKEEKSYVETYKGPEVEENKTGKSGVKMPALDLGGLKYVFYLIIAGAILFLVVKIIQNINASPIINIEKEKIYTLSEVEEKVLEVDLEKILNDALIEKDFRLALRINFLIIIKILSLKGKISWAKEKTNWEYYSEMKDGGMALKFREIVITFESIWYGEHALTEEKFNRLDASYKTFKDNWI